MSKKDKIIITLTSLYLLAFTCYYLWAVYTHPLTVRGHI
jgi:hypothetical protein